MKHVVIAPAGDHMDDLFIGIREFPTERIILVAAKDKKDEALIKKSANPMEEMMSKIGGGAGMEKQEMPKDSLEEMLNASI